MINTKVLKSGTRLAVSSMKGFEGVSFKLFVFCGSSNEIKEKEYGISHLIEHMFFKGTKTRDSYKIVQEFDEAGIQPNAYTSKDTTCYYTYGTNDSIEKSVELISDMFFNSVFDKVELEREKQVVLEEMLMYQDKPDVVCEISLEESFYKNTSFAHDIIGTKESVLNITREDILKYYKKHYSPKNIILSFAGNISLDEAEMLVNKYFEPYFKKTENFVYNPKKLNYNINKEQVKIVKSTKQAQVIIAYKTTNRYCEKETLIYSLISQILGGGMSSRLFQEVREKLGLVYTIQTYNEANNLAGLFSISFGTNLKNVPLALKTIKKVLLDVVNNGFTEEELNKNVKMAKTALKLKLDSPSFVATKIATCLQYKNEVYSKENTIKLIESITLNDINSFAKKLFSEENFVITMVSKSNKLDLFKYF